ncbi:UvrD-helicase domain-containing protein [Rhizobium sp. CF142]|uniref:UvrD-helicase domain-containing protein n=1 Tax=Rhizobium sp. CF142 TaxID=1144314 RepID=UPI00026F012F|nr:UvrD-helicase domain-containing protein [Rhizobium sp. CF142]EJJ27304.1 DNA/RNA helicase, superfamily I [Rhizobium sp. CF142]
MIVEAIPASNVGIDDHVDDELATYLNPENPRNFFLFAGAGSGKTRSLVKALGHIRRNHGRYLAFRGQRVGVITYTNAACDEIKRRSDFSSLFYVSTIHSFAWELIQGFSSDIREWLRIDLAADIARLNLEESKGRAGTKASITRQSQIVSKTKRLSRLDEISSFVYSPTGENSEPNSLNHSEVISICAAFLTAKPLMQWILIGRFPFLLIDESQDTNKYLIDAFFATAAAHEDRFGLGLIGDVMQRIYADGKEKIEKSLPVSWKTPEKKLNHRCPKRVVELINQIRSVADKHAQVPRSDAIEGHVRLYIRSVGAENRQAVEDAIRTDMAIITSDEKWNVRNDCKILTLEHHMAARRLGFDAVLQPLLAVESWRTGLLDGSLPATRFFSQIVLPLVEFGQKDDKFAVARIVREKSPLVSRDALKEAADPTFLLRKANDAVKNLLKLWDDDEPTCGKVLDCIAESNLFEIPDVLKPVVALRLSKTVSKPADDDADPVSEKVTALQGFLEAPFGQISLYNQYVSGLASFDTHQGVKGLEFERVMVIIDDSEARGFMFGYNKLFGIEGASPTDIKNVKEGKETGVDRTRRLLYVTCSRAEKSLSVVLYTENPQAAKNQALAQGWFKENEIDYS